jgi:HlyD family secretion protein
MKTHKSIAYAVLLMLILALGLAGCSAQPPSVGSTAEPETLPAVQSSSSVMAEGKVVPVQDALLTYVTGGVVDEVLVKEGDAVLKDQALLRLQGSETVESAVAAAELELLTAQQALTDLNDNASVARSQMLSELAAANRELDKATNRMESKDYLRGDQDQIDIARANYILAEEAVGDAEELYDMLDDRAEDDPDRAAALSNMAAKRQERDKALYNLNYLAGRPSPLDVGEIDARVAVAQARVADAQRRLALMEGGPDKNLLALAESRVKTAQAGVSAARAALDDLVLEAPFDGTVTSIDVSQGEFASPGVPAMRIADFSTLLVETTDLTELNVEKIRIGQPAMINFDAISGLGIIGRVTNIKPFGENRQGDVVYTVVLQLEQADPRLKWNMTASVTFLDENSLEK